MWDGTQHSHARSAASNRSVNSRRKAIFSLACLCVLGLAAFLGSGASSALAAAPSVTIENATEVSFASAKASGEVDPADHQVGYHFDYVTQAQFEASEWAESSQVAVGTLPAGAGPTPISEVLTGLAPGTVYHLRIRAVNGEDEVAEAIAAPFETETVGPPSASGVSVGAVTTDGAHFSGTVNSGGTGPGEKAGTYSFVCSPECPSVEGPHEFEAEGIADGSGHTVEADATGLQPHTEYTVTLRAQNAAAQSEASEAFTTGAIAPEVETLELHGPIASTTARLLGKVNAHNSATLYHFEYGTTTAYGSTTADAGPVSGNAAEAVGQNLTGLAPSTTYHYRIVADNGTGGPVLGADQILTTAAAPAAQAECANEAIRQAQGAQYLPDCRGYELVSTARLNSGGIVGARLASGVDDRAGLSYLGAAEGSPSGTQSTLVSTRTATGWKSKSLTPASALLAPWNVVAATTGDLSGVVNLSATGFISTNPVDFSVSRVPSGSDHAELLQFLGESTEGFGSFIASDDLSHVFLSTLEFQSGEGETPGATYIYDFGSGTAVLVSRLPGGGVPACGVANDSRLGFAVGGETHIWTRPASADGRRVYFQMSGNDCGSPSELYMRDQATATTELISGPPLAGPELEATFIQATGDGSQAFFLTSTRLAADDLDSSNDIYRHTVGAGNTCLTCGPVVAGLAGIEPGGAGKPVIAEDGSRVYFTAASPLAQGGSGDENDVYVWHDGEIHFAVPSSGLRPTATEVSADGRILVFRSNAAPLNALSGSDNGGRQQFYRYDDGSRSLTCISCPQDGSEPTSAASNNLVNSNTRFSQIEERRALSADGSTVAFLTRTALVPRDVNNNPDIYEWHAGEVKLISDGTTEHGVFADLELALVDVSADGRNILFFSTAKLTDDPIPQNPSVQVYTARVNGGFLQASGGQCEADACRSQPTLAPSAAPPGTSTFSGPGNKTRARPRPKKHHHRKPGHHKKPRHHKRNAGHQHGGAK